ncbi:MAG: methyl-accepting chemotaxis protein [Acidimicrobiales bacterium]
MFQRMLDGISVNVIFADEDNIIRYMNAASRRTLQEMQAHLPVPVEQIVGSSIDVFHRCPAHQRRLLADPANLPHQAAISLGPETMQLEAIALVGESGERLGTLAVWSRTTEATRQQALQVESLAAAIEELHASITEISSGAGRAAGVADEAMRITSAALELMQAMAAASDKVGDIVSFIAEIAGQSKLLALNATIEAARGGEAGRGFGVVALEVKELATASQRAAGDIRANIEAAQQRSREAVAAMQAISTVVSDVRDAAGTIAAAVEEQTAVVAEIARSASAVTSATTA